MREHSIPVAGIWLPRIRGFAGTRFNTSPRPAASSHRRIQHGRQRMTPTPATPNAHSRLPSAMTACAGDCRAPDFRVFYPNSLPSVPGAESHRHPPARCQQCTEAFTRSLGGNGGRLCPPSVPPTSSPHGLCGVSPQPAAISSVHARRLLGKRCNFMGSGYAKSGQPSVWR